MTATLAAAARTGEGRTTAIRCFVPDHIPDVVRLRRAMLRTTERPDDTALASYYARVFFANPWYDPLMPSLVAEHGGHIVGFIGVIPRPFVFRGEAVKAAVSTEFMVEPEYQGKAGLLLLQAYLKSGQDLSLVDRANESARVLLEAMGGRPSSWHSFYWSVPLRRLRHALSQVQAGGVLRPMVAAARRGASALDAVRPATRQSDGLLEPLEAFAADDAVAALPRILTGRCDLYARYDVRSFEWLLERVAEKTSYGVLDAFTLRERDEITGWCIMLVRPGGRAEVVQWAAARDWERALFDAACSRATASGAITLAGRLDPAFAPMLSELRIPFTLAQPWTLVHTRRPELLQAVTHGRAFLSRLDGEWWLST